MYNLTLSLLFSPEPAEGYSLSPISFSKNHTAAVFHAHLIRGHKH